MILLILHASCSGNGTTSSQIGDMPTSKEFAETLRHRYFSAERPPEPIDMPLFPSVEGRDLDDVAVELPARWTYSVLARKAIENGQYRLIAFSNGWSLVAPGTPPGCDIDKYIYGLQLVPSQGDCIDSWPYENAIYKLAHTYNTVLLATLDQRRVNQGHRHGDERYASVTIRQFDRHLEDVFASEADRLCDALFSEDDPPPPVIRQKFIHSRQNSAEDYSRLASDFLGLSPLTFARQAFEEGNLRLVAVHDGNELRVPGVPAGVDPPSYRYGLQIVRGYVNDTLSISYVARLQNFAADYNAQLLELVLNKRVAAKRK
jgi:hypothetical protein